MSKENNIFKEYTFTVPPGGTYPLEFWPYKMRIIEVFNLGANDAQVALNDQSFANGLTVSASGYRRFRERKPSYARISFYSVLGTNFRVAVAR